MSSKSLVRAVSDLQAKEKQQQQQRQQQQLGGKSNGENTEEVLPSNG